MYTLQLEQHYSLLVILRITFIYQNNSLAFTPLYNRTQSYKHYKDKHPTNNKNTQPPDDPIYNVKFVNLDTWNGLRPLLLLYIV